MATVVHATPAWAVKSQEGQQASMYDIDVYVNHGSEPAEVEFPGMAEEAKVGDILLVRLAGSEENVYPAVVVPGMDVKVIAEGQDGGYVLEVLSRLRLRTSLDLFDLSDPPIRVAGSVDGSRRQDIRVRVISSSGKGE